MRKLILAVGLTLAVPATAVARPVTPSHRAEYVRDYHAVRAKFGAQVAGCNLIERRGNCHVTPTDEAVMKSDAVLQRDLAPPPAPNVARRYEPSSSASTGISGRSATYSTAPASASGGGAGGVPACASESGSNYSTGPLNTNSSSGATGRYQITPSTAANYGCNLSTPGGQDACAQVIYANQGTSAWVGCGG